MRKEGSGGSREQITIAQFNEAKAIMDSNKPFSGNYISKKVGLSPSVVTEIGNGQRYIDENGELATRRTAPGTGQLPQRKL